jgi:hypothetical protein
MKFLTKSLLSAGAAAAAAVSLSAPVQARDHRDGDGISAGEVIAGALVIGGLAAILSDNDRDSRYSDRDYRYDRAGYGYGDDHRRGGYDRGHGYGYGNRYGGSRAAVNQCINAVERWGSRYSRTDVTRIHDIDRTRYGYRVSGNIVVKDGWRGRDRYDHGYGRDYDRGYERGYDKGRFTCYIERGRVVDIDYRGLDRWR